MGLRSYTQDDLEDAAAKILVLLADDVERTRNEIHRAIGGTRQRVTQVALCHLVADRLVNERMRGRGYRYRRLGPPASGPGAAPAKAPELRN